MTPRDVFALVVRITGLLSLLWLLATGIVLFSGVPWFYIVRTLVWLVLSIWLIRGAPQLVNYAYPEED